MLHSGWGGCACRLGCFLMLGVTTRDGRRIRLIAGLLLLLVACSYLMGARSASPGFVTAARDLDLLRQWRTTGHLGDHPDDPSHLPKAGYLAYLAGTLTRAGSDTMENRRFLVLNSLWVLGGVALGVAGLAIRRDWGRVAGFALFMLGFLQARDACDYVSSEPISLGLGLSTFGLLHIGRSHKAFAAAGVLGAAACLVRPNVGAWLLLVGLAIASESKNGGRRTKVLSFGLVFMLILAAGHVALAERGDSSSLGGSARTLLWGTADYYWRWDLDSGWPTGTSQAETTRLQSRLVIERWLQFAAAHPDRVRSLMWRLGHAIFSAEELPARWNAARYLQIDKTIRYWWWLGCILLILLATLTALGGNGRWRIVPLLTMVACVVQGLLFGADPRLALPFIPLAALSCAFGIRAARLRLQGLLALMCTSASSVVVLLLAPDAAASDFAVIRSGRHVLEQQLVCRGCGQEGSRILRMRLLQEYPFNATIRIFGNGALLYKRQGGQDGRYPAVFSMPVDVRGGAGARKRTLVRVEMEVPPGENNFVYFPVVPSIFDGRAAVDGSRRLSSGYGGYTEGGLPLWCD